MEQQLQLLAQLAAVDAELDELHEELGDLPVEVKKIEKVVRTKQEAVDATKALLDELHQLRSTAHVTMQESHDKEQKLAQQQFQVKNNREFDAITKEIEHLKQERINLEERLRTAGVREENQTTTLEQQQAELDEVHTRLVDKQKALEAMSGDQNEDLKKFIALRLKIIAKLDDTLEAEYERIRTFHSEAAVALRRNSCSGCYSAIPSQRIMEMKYQRDRMYTCESCGRILFTEDVAVDIEELLEAAK
ncbi:MAG: zinc ribbon domain-containing protein [Candidatus Kapaibacterium sp.]